MLADLLSTYLGKRIKTLKPLSGGDINEVFLIDTSEGQLVAKVNRSDRFPKMFIKEANGLNSLRGNGLRVPEVLGTFEGEDRQFLLLEYLPSGQQGSDYWEGFANGLAKLHRSSSSDFGWTEDNYIGSLEQVNTSFGDWTSFFIHSRLQPMVELAQKQNLLSVTHIAKFERLYSILNDLIPKEVPSLLHGDLWSGNVFCSYSGEPVIIDPATYYGHREMDLAMTQLFGGFSHRYLEIYHEVFPLEKGWQERLEIHNLYPNLVHLNLFGSSYLRGVESVINKYC